MKPELRKEIIYLWKIGRPVQEIADRLGVTTGAVRRVALSEKLLRDGKEYNAPNNTALRATPTSVHNGNLFQEATLLLGRRYKETRGQMFLDNRPCTMHDVMIAVNTYLAKHKKPQLGKNAAWLVNSNKNPD